MKVGHLALGWYCQLWTNRTGKRNIYEDYGDKLWKRAYGRLNNEQRAAMDAAYNAKNAAFVKANLKGDDVVRWKYQRTMKNYLGCIKSVDDNVGRLMRYLKNAGLEENTLVIYASDQGLFLGEHGYYDKRLMYEEAARTPLIAYCPSFIPPQQVNRDLVQNIDYAPTMLDVAGVAIPKRMQGESFKPLLMGKKMKNPRNSLYYHYYDYPSGSNIQKHDGVITARYKLLHFYDINEWEFYDIQRDPKEMHNEYDNPNYKNEISTLKKELLQLRKKYEVPNQ